MKMWKFILKNFFSPNYPGFPNKSIFTIFFQNVFFDMQICYRVSRSKIFQIWGLKNQRFVVFVTFLKTTRKRKKLQTSVSDFVLEKEVFKTHSTPVFFYWKIQNMEPSILLIEFLRKSENVEFSLNQKCSPLSL